MLIYDNFHYWGMQIICRMVFNQNKSYKQLEMNMNARRHFNLLNIQKQSYLKPTVNLIMSI